MVYWESVEAYALDRRMGKKKGWDYGSEWLPKFPMRPNKKSMRFRRAQNIIAYVGQNGSGKTLAAVRDTLPSLGQKWFCDNPNHYHMKQFGQTEGYRHVLSSVLFLDPRTGLPHPLYIPYTSSQQLLFAEHVDIVFDEVQGLMSARENYSVPLVILNLLSQMRKKDCVLRWTTPSWSNAAAAIKTVTKAVVYCKGSFPVGIDGSMWSSNRILSFKAYRASDFETFTVGVRERLLPESSELFFMFGNFNRSGAPAAYDTMAEVLSSDAQTLNGVCLHCGGTRRIGPCKCVIEEVDSQENYDRMYKEFLEKSGKTAAQAGEGEADVFATLAENAAPPTDAPGFSDSSEIHIHGDCSCESD